MNGLFYEGIGVLVDDENKEHQFTLDPTIIQWQLYTYESSFKSKQKKLLEDFEKDERTTFNLDHPDCDL